MKRLNLGVFLLLSILFLNGCADVNTSLTINCNGSAELTQIMLFDQNVVSMLGGLEQFEDDYEKQGFKVQSLNENNKLGIKATKKFRRVSQVFDQKISSNHKLFKKNKEGITEFNVSKGLILNKYKINCQIDLKSDQTSGKTKQINRLISNMMMNFQLNLPVRPDFHNASKVSEDGKTLEWTIIAGQTNNIQVYAREINYYNLTILSLTVLILVILIIFSFKWKTKPSKNNE